MRRFTIGSLALMALLAATPAAAAHLTIAAVAPAAPLLVGVPTSVAVTASASCATVAYEYKAAGKESLDLEIQGAQPSWLSNQSANVPFKLETCGTDAKVTSTGDVKITPSEMAPGLETVNITFGARGEAGSAVVPIKVAYRGLLNVSGPAEAVPVVDDNATTSFTINATMNADSMIMVEVTAPLEKGTVTGLPTMLDLASPLAEGRTFRLTTVTLSYMHTPGAEEGMDMLGLRVMLHSKKDPTQAAPIQELMIHFEEAGHEDGEHNHSTHDHAEAKGGNIPGLDAIVILLGIGAIAGYRRRH